MCWEYEFISLYNIPIAYSVLFDKIKYTISSAAIVVHS